MHTAKTCPFHPKGRHDREIASTSEFSAIYNIAPILPGHTLVIPTRHAESLLDLSADELGRYAFFARRVTDALLAIFEADGFNWTLQDGPSAGQTVGHLHVHVIPRREGDLPQPGDWYPKLQQQIGDGSGPVDSERRPRLSDSELRRLASAIRKRGAELGVLPLTE
jgi:bis(5'-adenosyl)-triphosphatase